MIELVGTVFVDQGHDALGDIVFEKEAVIDRCDNVDNGVSHGNDVEIPRHLFSPIVPIAPIKAH